MSCLFGTDFKQLDNCKEGVLNFWDTLFFCKVASIASYFNPNRSLGRFLYPFSLSQFCLCHISISLCSMMLLGFGIVSKFSLCSRKNRCFHSAATMVCYSVTVLQLCVAFTPKRVKVDF